MLKRTGLLLFIIIVGTQLVPAQEIQARFTVLTGQISTEVDKKIFQTLQTAVANFVNNRKWTTDDFQPNEKIQCNFLLNVEKDLGNSLYQGTLTVQAARPIYSTSYDSPIINVIDKDVVFRYQEFQPIEFNENRVQGNDPSAANLPAILAYYVNIILGFDYGSFALRGGDTYFKKAWNIVSNAPESSNITGWRAFEDIRNRYWLAENMTNNRFALMHDALYTYYRLGLDRFYENEAEAREGVANCLNFLNTVNTENPNSMVMQFFFQGKSNELVKIFSKADSDTKKRIRDILSKLDITNTTAYKELK